MFVDCFLLVPNKLLHAKIFSWIGESSWTLHVSWMFTMIDVISLHSLILGKVRQEAILEDLEIIVGSTGIGPGDPHHISSHDVQANFIPNSTLLELVAVELRTILRHLEVCAINGDKAVIPLILLNLFSQMICQ